MSQRKLRPVQRHLIRRALGPNNWDLNNKVLYDLCRDQPKHDDKQAVLAKINIIGRVYAAAIERRKMVGHDETNERFFVHQVAPAMMRSNLDKWIDQASSIDPNDELALATMLEIHGRTMDLFYRVSGLKKRSLASKYLHFHVPHLFFIYDARALKAIASISVPTIENKRADVGDPSYRAFAVKCDALRAHCESRVGVRLTPRQLDNFLLSSLQ